MPRYHTHGIPTLYRGRWYRSRLEARWAAFFDLLGWDFEYEPFDLAGWIPDFILPGMPNKSRNTLVEIKPGMGLEAFDRTKIERTIDPTKPGAENVLLLGYRPDQSSLGWSGFCFGALDMEACYALERGDVASAIQRLTHEWHYHLAILCRHEKGWDYYNKQTNFRSCIHGVNNDNYPYVAASKHLWDTTKALWAQAGNETQWKKPRHT